MAKHVKKKHSKVKAEATLNPVKLSTNIVDKMSKIWGWEE